MAREANIPVFKPQPNRIQEPNIGQEINRVEAIKEPQRISRTPDNRDDLRFIQQQQLQNRRPTGEIPMLKPPSATQGIQNFQNIPEQYPSQQVASLNTLLKEDIEIHVADLKERGTSPETLDKMDELEQQVILKERGEQVDTLQQIGSQALGFNPEDELKLSSTGGLIGMAAGGMFDGRVRGDGHGMQDNVFMPIKERGEQVATLAVSPKEYVVDAHTMSAIGNGNADKGADVMDNVVENIREKAYGTDRQPNQINGLAALRPMMERV